MCYNLVITGKGGGDVRTNADAGHWHRGYRFLCPDGDRRSFKEAVLDVGDMGKKKHFLALFFLKRNYLELFLESRRDAPRVGGGENHLIFSQKRGDALAVVVIQLGKNII